MRLARAAAIQRGLQQSVTPVTAGLPVLSPSDCGGPSLLTGSSSTIVAGLKRGMSVPRAGVPGPSSSIASASLGSMLLPGGVGMSTGGPSPGSGVPAQMNVIRRPRDLAQLRVSVSPVMCSCGLLKSYCVLSLGLQICIPLLYPTSMLGLWTNFHISLVWMLCMIVLPKRRNTNTGLRLRTRAGKRSSSSCTELF